MRYLRLVLFMCLAAFLAFDAIAWEVTDDNGHLLRVNGDILYRGRNYNLDFDNDSERFHLNRLNYFGDLSLKFTMKPSENITGYFELHKFVFLGQEYRYNTIQTGEEVVPEDIPWLLPDGTPAVTLPDGTAAKLPLRRNTDEAWEMHLRQAWMDVKMPGGIPLNMKFGRQCFMLGNGIYTNTNIASVFGWQFYTNWGSEKISLRAGSMKFYEGLREDWEEEVWDDTKDVEKASDRDDADLYFVDAAKMVNFGKSTKIGAFLANFQDCTVGLDKITHSNLGLTADVALDSGWSLKTEFNYQVGTAENYNVKDDAGNVLRTVDVDLSGYSFMANVGVPAILNNKVKLSGEFGIGSGDDPDTVDEFEGYVGVGPFYPYAWAYEYRFLHFIHNSSNFFTKYGSRGMFNNLAPGLENTTYLKGTAAITLPKVLDMVANPQFIFSPIYLGMTQEGEAFGYEIDNILVLPVYKNFSYMFIFAYVIPSDYMKDKTTGPDIKDDSWAIRSQVSFTF